MSLITQLAVTSVQQVFGGLGRCGFTAARTAKHKMLFYDH